MIAQLGKKRVTYILLFIMGQCISSEQSAAPDCPTVPTVPTVPTSESKEDIKLSNPNPYLTATYENTHEYTLEGLRTTVKILRILDGDTVDIALYHEAMNKVYRHRVRLYGIDTPEKRPSLSDPNRQLEMEASKKAKEALEQRIRENDFIVLAIFYSSDKYGRLLCTFYDKTGEDINKWMVSKGYAYEYHGKTKKKFDPVILQLSQQINES